MEMFKLKPVETKKKRVCQACYTQGEVKSDCRRCHGAGVIGFKTIRYKVDAHPVEIVKVDRDPKTGIIRYWENLSEFFYETTTPKLNKYVPEVPFGIHLIHKRYAEAIIEAERINKALEETEVKANKEFIKKPWYVQKQEEHREEVVEELDEELFNKLNMLMLTDNSAIDYVRHVIGKLRVNK